ncbi:MAG: GNAT family N-acetyltransferase [Neomegalonema sp.]|nr:GNAT family N-acetyltransferase [Neomegalonema sp.]
MRLDSGRFTVRLAETEEEIASAQALRYRVFVEEMGAKASEEDAAEKRERDRFDPFCKHLLLLDNSIEESGNPVVGVYRLLHGADARGTEAAPGPGFYTAGEYDLTPIMNYPRETLELGRSCVASEYRGTAAMQLLWMALSQYIVIHDIGLMFGTASFHGSEIEPLKVPLSFLYHNHLAPADLRPRTLDEHYVDMNLMPPDAIDRTEAMRQLPALMKGYMRLGGFVGDGAFIDHEFNTVDVCLVMDTEKIAGRYKKFYARRAPSDLARILG